jgi:hypothetical protein
LQEKKMRVAKRKETYTFDKHFSCQNKEKASFWQSVFFAKPICRTIVSLFLCLASCQGVFS